MAEWDSQQSELPKDVACFSACGHLQAWLQWYQETAIPHRLRQVITHHRAPDPLCSQGSLVQ